MGTKTSIAALIAALLLVLVVGGAYAYDSSQKEKIAEGVTIGGVDVSGLDEEEARAKVHRKLVAPLQTSLGVSFEGKTWKLTGKQLKIRADLDAAVEEAVEDSQEGGLPGRLVRYVSGGEVEESIRPQVAYSEPAVNRFVRRIAEEINREPENADVDASGESLEVVAGKNGRKLRDNLLEKDLKAAVLNANAPHAIEAEVRSLAPEITRQEVAAQYPSYLTLDRDSYTLRLWKNLKLAKTYTVAVGAEGFATPEGLYQIESMEENPVWNVPESDWAGSLAGQTIPPGPENPIKARWMGIFEGAGIHGTEETSSLGTAASHGCVRMAISDVEELYEEVEIGTPVYLG
jgi:lipoprotein-anchoring transpeptidase ErfK/SrfK